MSELMDLSAAAGRWTLTRRQLLGATVLSLGGSAAPGPVGPVPVVAQSSPARVPVLCYHGVDYGGGQYAVTPEQLSAQCQWLVANGYQSLSLWEFWASLTGGTPLPAAPVVLTNDDGLLSALQFGQILANSGLRATYFVNNLSALGADQIGQLAQYGLVQGHTASHAHLPGLSREEQLAEIVTNQAYLSGITGQPVQFLAWPFGMYDTVSVEVAQSAGMVAAFGLGGTAVQPGAVSPFALPRIMIEGIDSIESFAQKVMTY